MPKGNRTGVGAKKKQAARKAVMKRGVPKGSANKRPVVNAGSDSSRTRMRGAKNVESNRRKVNEMKAKKRQRAGGGSRGY